MTVQVAPSISACPANQTVNTDPGTCTALVSFTPPTATAGCPVPTVTCRIGATPVTSPHAFPVGTSTVTCTASNGVAPDASCSFTVTVNDTENPVITCPADIVVTESSPGSGSAVVNYTAPVGTDACPGATTVQTAGLASGSPFPVGVTTNTFRVTDAAGNMATCSFTVTVTSACMISCPTNITVPNDPGQCGAIVNFRPDRHRQLRAGELHAAFRLVLPRRHDDGNLRQRGRDELQLHGDGHRYGESGDQLPGQHSCV